MDALERILEKAISLEESAVITKNVVDDLAQGNVAIRQAIREITRLQDENRRLSIQNARYLQALDACHAELREYENSTGHEPFKNEDYND